MINFCQRTTHKDAETIQQILAFNDSNFLMYLKQFDTNSTTDSIPDGRNLLQEALKSRIPGALLIECKILNYLWIYFPPFLLIFGSAANFLALLVLCQRSMLRTSTYIYMVSITAIDEITLLTGLLRRWVDYLIGFRIENYNDLICKFTQYIGCTISYSSVWLIVVMTIERLIIMTLPFRANQLINTHKSKIIIIVTILFFSLFPLHLFETISIYKNSNYQNISLNLPLHKLKCNFKDKYERFRNIWTIIDASIYSFIPLILIVIFNMIIIYKTNKASKNRKLLIHQNKKQKRPNLTTKENNSKSTNQIVNINFCSRNNEAKQLTMILLTISFVFLFTTTPLVTLKMITKIIDFQDKTTKVKSQILLLSGIFELMMYTNHSINFLLYCAAGKRFRLKLMDLFHKITRTFDNSSITNNCSNNFTMVAINCRQRGPILARVDVRNNQI